MQHQSISKQVEKYCRYFGPGALVFSQGFSDGLAGILGPHCQLLGPIPAPCPEG
jgi:hypothetical protein